MANKNKNKIGNVGIECGMKIMVFCPSVKNCMAKPMKIHAINEPYYTMVCPECNFKVMIKTGGV